MAAIGDRMEQVGLRLHPDKTKVVYCQDGNRRLDYGLTAFTFLGFTFRARAARTKHGTMFVAFQPAISKDAQNKISGQIRRWRLHRWIGLHPRRDRPTDQPCRAGLDAVLRGVLPLRAVSAPVAHQRLRDALDPQQVQTAAHHQESQGMLAAHHPPTSPALRPLGMGARFLVVQDDKSPVTRDCHAGICGSRRVRPPPATRQEHRRHCSFSNRVSYSDRLTCCDACCLTRCHLASVSDRNLST